VNGYPESGIGVSVSQKAPEDVIYDKQWALIVMNRALERLEEEFVKSEKQSLFDILKPWLVGETEGLSQKSAAEQLETNEGAVKVAIHRMRKKFRQILKNEIAKTLDIEADVKQELNYLVEVLSQ
jgi:RNA polymerase sigma-70 factor (ECF subfamily)